MPCEGMYLEVEFAFAGRRHWELQRGIGELNTGASGIFILSREMLICSEQLHHMP